MDVGLPERRSDAALLAAARAFLSEGETARERFLPLGLPDTFLSELQVLVEQFERATDRQRAGRADLSAAQARIDTAIARGCQAVRALDVVVSNILAGNPEVLSAWKRERRIRPRPNGPTAVVKPTAATDPTVPAPSPVVLGKAS